MENDLIIIGGGPAGCAAGVYAARKLLKTVLITETFGGQSTDSLGVENWIGTVKIPGPELAKQLEAHVRAYAGDVVNIVTGERVTKLEKEGDGFKVSTKNGKTFTAKSVLIASGASRRKLEVPGADLFENKGLTYCASCDGPLFAGQDVVVIGGGNAGFESAAQLLAYCKSVTLLSRSDFKADPITVEKVLSHPNMKGIVNSMPTAVLGDKFVSGLKYTDPSGEHEIAVSGVFVEIGLIPSTDFAQGVVEMDEVHRIKVDGKNQKTSVPGIWAAGDCTDELYHQNNIAAGDAVKALEDIYMHLRAR